MKAAILNESFFHRSQRDEKFLETNFKFSFEINIKQRLPFEDARDY